MKLKEKNITTSLVIFGLIMQSSDLIASASMYRLDKRISAIKLLEKSHQDNEDSFLDEDEAFVYPELQTLQEQRKILQEQKIALQEQRKAWKNRGDYRDVVFNKYFSVLPDKKVKPIVALKALGLSIQANKDDQTQGLNIFGDQIEGLIICKTDDCKDTNCNRSKTNYPTKDEVQSFFQSVWNTCVECKSE